MCRDTFFEERDEDNAIEPFAVINHVNDEYWLNYRTVGDVNRNMIFSYRWGDIGTFTRKYSAYGTVHNPFEGTITGASKLWFLAGDDQGRVLLHASTNKNEGLLNGRKGFWGVRGRMTGLTRTLRHDGKHLIASLDFFTIADEGKFVFISKNDLTYDVRTITQFISPTHVVTDIVDVSEPFNGGIFDEYLENGILDGLEAFVTDDGAGQEEDEIEMEAITPIMGSLDSGAPVTLEVFTAKNPSDERLGTKVKRVDRIIKNPRFNRVGMWHRGNYFQTRISVNNSLLDARFSSKIFRFRRLKASDGFIRTTRSQLL